MKKKKKREKGQEGERSALPVTVGNNYLLGTGTHTHEFFLICVAFSTCFSFEQKTSYFVKPRSVPNAEERLFTGGFLCFPTEISLFCKVSSIPSCQ